MFLFFVLAILVWLALVRLIHNRHHRAAVTIVICILLAAFDELHQKSVPGRSGELRDIMVDGAGVLIAMILFTMPALSKWLRSHIAHPAVLLTAGVICGGLLLIWSGTLDRMPQAFMHRTTQVDYFASMEKGTARIVTKDKTISIKEGDIFYIPKSLGYQSYWYGNEEVAFFHMDVIISLPLTQKL